MKSLIVLALALCSSAAFAARPNTASLTCRDATGLVADRGAVVMSHGNYSLYQRFVAGSQFCGTGEKAASAYVQTLDNDSCRIGYVCVDRDSGGSSVKFPSDIYTCKDGSFGTARKSDYYPGNYGDKEPTITVVCQAGKWVPANDRGWKLPKTKGGLVCKEGALDYYPSLDKENGYVPPGTIVRKCVGGKWIRQN